MLKKLGLRELRNLDRHSHAVGEAYETREDIFVQQHKELGCLVLRCMLRS